MEERALIEYFDHIEPYRALWKATNAYYYAYLESLLGFLVPKGKKVLKLEVGDSRFWKRREQISDEECEYIIAIDVLGYIKDVGGFMEGAKRILKPNGRIIITQYNALWEPVLRVASALGLRMPSIEQNWLSMHDLKNFAHLAGLEVVKSGAKMLFPEYIPILSSFLNKFVANIFPFS